jgi:mono/diheme cytochrome c family protein
MKPIMGALLLASLLTTAPAQAALLIRGEALVERNCSHCHAAGPMDASPNPQAPPLRTLHRYSSMKTLSEALHRGLLVSHFGMPQLKFTSEQIDDIMLYIERLQASDTEQKRAISGTGAGKPGSAAPL